MMNSFGDTIGYLNSFTNFEKIGLDGIKKSFDLGKLRAVLERLGNPQYSYKCAHIAGTKGKGSIACFTASILGKSGFKTGLYTSPHLVSPLERIRINGESIGEEDMVLAVSALKEALGKSPFENYTFFEVYTLLAILYFSLKKTDYAVFETGLGGRLDATNVIDGEVSGISPVSYDHMAVLGDTLEQIAGEKAAIIKRGRYCVSSPQRPEALNVIRRRCEEQNAGLSLVGKDIEYKILDINEYGTAFDIKTPRKKYDGCHTSMLGGFQAANCAAAAGICEVLAGAERMDPDRVREGISDTFLRSRIEVLRRDPLLVIDGAQNGESAEKLRYSVEEIFKYDKLILILGISRDKDIKGITDELVPLADHIILTKARVSRAADPYIIRGFIKGKKTDITADVREALGMAFYLAGKNDMILAAGSFFLTGEILELIDS
ncbi:MAG: folylpolyglutamate synthase/dihydrofolate synthase family protein [Candidatus Omnitrophota bacterium]